jgi:hypothetical protein
LQSSDAQAQFVAQHFTIVAANGTTYSYPGFTEEPVNITDPHLMVQYTVYPDPTMTITVRGQKINSQTSLQPGDATFAQVTITVPANWTSLQVAQYIVTELLAGGKVTDIMMDCIKLEDHPTLITQLQTAGLTEAVQYAQNAANLYYSAFLLVPGAQAPLIINDVANGNYGWAALGMFFCTPLGERTCLPHVKWTPKFGPVHLC